MSEQIWTPQQNVAISSLGGSLIVCAAAGSGKTSVLIERIIRKISDENNPCDIDNLLIVTFTKNAASEMRIKMTAALEKKIRENPDNAYLKKQYLKLPQAEFCTMDSFFNNLVKEHFHALDITPDYRILDNSESNLLSAEAMDEVLEKMYDENSDDFSKLLDLFGCENNDGMLASGIKQLADYSVAFANSEKWLDSIIENYSSDTKPQDTLFGKTILERIESQCIYAKQLIAKAKVIVEGYEGLEKIQNVLVSDEAVCDSVLAAYNKGDWDEIKEKLGTVKFDTFPTVKAEYRDTYEKINAQKLCNTARALVKDVKFIIPATEEEYFSDIEFLRPPVKKLIDITKAYQKRFLEKKKEVNAYNFSDIAHLALNLLCDKNGNPTPLALEIREKYTEILIDEYQDTNEAQDTAFCTVSKNKSNMFLVGDVKQSIYRFRLAMPQIFINRSLEWKQSESEYPKSINLDMNFRSRKGILDSVNYLFTKIMSEKAGDIDYDEDAALKYGAKYEPSDTADTEICILESKELEDYKECDYIADRISNILNSDMKLRRKDGTYTKVQCKDICVLTRRNAPAALINSKLNSVGIPSFFEENAGFFDNTEVSVMLSMLCVIDNPLQDVPLLSVIMSAFFGFSADDVAEVRVGCRSKKLYYAIQNSQLEICKEFMKKYSEYRRLSTVMSVSSLIRFIYEDTGYISVMSALDNGDKRKLNLLLLLEYAEQYETYGNSSLAGFIRFIEKIKKNDGDFKPANCVSEYANVVRIMTVHKSKGLEFPIVFLADCGHTKNRSGANLIINEKFGIGLKIIDKKSFRKFNTVQFEAAKDITERQDCSEELRVLYVAMTRAKEKLIITGTISKSAADFVSDCSVHCTDENISPIAVENQSSLLGLMVMGYLRHPSADVLRRLADYRYGKDDADISPVEFTVVSEPLSFTSFAGDEQTQDGVTNTATLGIIRQKTQYEYPYMPLSSYPTKKAASSFNRTESDDAFFACDVPKFASEGGLTAAGSGTATHRFMEVCDFSLAEQDFEKEKERLVSQNKLTPQQADVLKEDKIKAFFKSNLFNRIKASTEVLREQKFTISVPLSFAEKIDDEKLGNEEILVQGVIDCAFFENGQVVVVDYKTDRVKSLDELSERYHRQLEIYKIAAEQIFATEVKQLLLYSFSLSDETEIKL